MGVGSDASARAVAGIGAPVENRSTGLLLCRDLIFTSKVQGTAGTLGHHILVSGDRKQARSLIEAWAPRVVFVDLTAGDLVEPAALIDYRQQAGSETWFVAFGPHVEGELLAGAKAPAVMSS